MDASGVSQHLHHHALQRLERVDEDAGTIHSVRPLLAQDNGRSRVKEGGNDPAARRWRELATGRTRSPLAAWGKKRREGSMDQGDMSAWSNGRNDGNRW
jgi:hypothetical protein